MIFHIYWGTSGNSGLYLDAIYKVLAKSNFSQKVFVSYYYPFDYGEKLFFRYGDIANSSFKGWKRKVVQIFEIQLSFLRIYGQVIYHRPKIINYSHIGQSNLLIFALLFILNKICSGSFVITCHDVSPHEFSKSELFYRKKIFELADSFLVHNKSSRQDLIENFQMDESKIVSHPFPIMDLKNLFKVEETSERFDFLFIGHLRKDKGVEFLVEAWKEFHTYYPKASLALCGKLGKNVFLDVENLEHFNIFLKLDYISDYDYMHFVESSRYVVFPYLQGANSGVISTVLSLGKDVIVSDIPMFLSSPLIDADDTFERLNKASLIEALTRKYTLEKRQKQSSHEKLRAYIEHFNTQVKEVYHTLFN